jgi:polysaccharide biosynthesis/export protein
VVTRLATLFACAGLAALVAPAAVAAQAGGSAAPQDGGQAPAAKPRTGPPPPEPTPTAQRQPSGIPDDRAYRINPGDQVEVYVWGDERLQRALRVLPDGSFAFPLVGTIKAEGRTASQLEVELANRLATQFRGVAPQVTVSVAVPSGLQISVIGKVRGPGAFSPGRYLNLLEALALAGGPADFADVNNIVILRTKGGQTTVVNAGLSSVLRGRPSERDLTSGGIPMLQPGDTVIVP